MTGQHYSEREKLEAITAVVVTGSSTKAEKLVNIPSRTIRDWRSQEWWPAAEEKIRAETECELLANIGEIVEAGRREMLDRIQHGDYCYKPNGEPLIDENGVHLRKKVGLTPLTIATGTMFDKRQILLHRPTAITASTQSLENIARQLAEFAQYKREKVVDGMIMQG